MQRRVLDPVFASALLVSVLLHGAALVAAPRVLEEGGAASPDEREDPMRPVRVGVERSDAVTLTWLGFEEPEPHEARRSEVEQAPLALNSPAPAEETPTPDEPAPAEPAPAETTAAEPAPSEPEPAGNADATPDAGEPAEHEAGSDRPTDAAEEPATEPLDEPARPAGPERSAEVAALKMPVGEGTETTSSAADAPGEGREASARQAGGSRAAPAPPSSEQARATPRAPEEPAAQPAEAQGEPTEHEGVPSEAEAPPTSQEKPAEVRPGRPLAAQGLRIKTRVPADFTIPTRLFGAPRRPIYAVSFDYRGVVRRVELLRSSGNRDVDGPWRQALYRWEAEGAPLDDLPRGEELAELPPADPRRWVTIHVELVAP